MLKKESKMKKNRETIIVLLVATVIMCIAKGILLGIFTAVTGLFYGFTVFTIISFFIHLIQSAKTITKHEIIKVVFCIVLIYLSFRYSNQILLIIRGVISKYA